MKLRHIEVFFAVMTHGTVTAAARQLGISQPSVTITLKQAEARLGIQLFLRDSGRLVPTEEAHLLYEEAKRAHDALAALNALAENLSLGRGGHVRVAAVPSMSHELLPDAIERFEQRHSGFQYSVATMNSENITAQLDSRKGAYDLGFFFGEQADAGIAATVIGDLSLFAVIPASWKIGDASETRLEDLGDYPYITGFDHTALALECNRLFSDAGLEPKVVARSHTHYLSGCLVQRGLGYTILDELTARSILRNDRAKSVVVKHLDGRPTLPLTAIYPGQRTLSNPATLFIECIQKAFDELTGA